MGKGWNLCSCGKPKPVKRLYCYKCKPKAGVVEDKVCSDVRSALFGDAMTADDVDGVR
jgi:hypothetical protein